MRTGWRKTALLLALLGASAAAQGPPRSRAALRPFFPLAVGNRWVYQEVASNMGGFRTVEVVSTRQWNGNTYYELTGFGGETAWVRQTPEGALVEYDPAAGEEKLWYAFLSSQPWSSRLSLPCLGQAEIVKRGEALRTGAETFPGGLVIRYANNRCADAGLIEEAFAPGVGLVRRSELTIAGPRIYELYYARVNGREIGSPP